MLEFGRYGSDLGAYILVANFLTRRIHRQYVEKKEDSFGEAGKGPTPLVITIEEAHKFLDPAIAANTIFGTIARELRKYNVTLFIVDQRPSGIDPEVMSQIGTRVTMLLDNPEDIKAVLSGVSGGEALREVLARLDTREQALILGHAVPMPVVVQTRRYDTEFYKAMGSPRAGRAPGAARTQRRKPCGRRRSSRGLIETGDEDSGLNADRLLIMILQHNVYAEIRSRSCVSLGWIVSTNELMSRKLKHADMTDKILHSVLHEGHTDQLRLRVSGEGLRERARRCELRRMRPLRSNSRHVIDSSTTTAMIVG